MSQAEQLKRVIQFFDQEVVLDRIILSMASPVSVWSWSYSFFFPRRAMTFRQYLLEMVDKNFAKAERIVNALENHNMAMLIRTLNEHRLAFHPRLTTGMAIYKRCTRRISAF